MATNLSDLNEVLFAQLGRLNNDALEGDDLERELRRSSGVTSLSKEIVSNARLVLDGEKHRKEFGIGYKLPKVLESKE
ncbi:hypothetical protein MIH18_23550 (plasmid) [Marinobacter sp. M3C]|jgi:hypothetical protein|uniref:hypothetical protein n=1 Tax=Marinobacter sp. M3C TaxID=2917715 RepID=UPI00200C669C|nr:hypothetical protein [Marinobacter sp. M3C]MCL1485167.1 hypothetical protein [Marinobacter sp.]UQG62808.1 hypothetical protein MIH18_23550 [Marinobacter sp. M3C]